MIGLITENKKYVAKSTVLNYNKTNINLIFLRGSDIKISTISFIGITFLSCFIASCQTSYKNNNFSKNVQALQKEESLVVKKLSLDDDLELKSKIIEFNSKSNIITNGHSVRIIAETILIKNYSADHVQIVSFQEAEKPTGMAGRDAHDIYIFSKNIIGGSLLISNKGENGFQGLQGEKGSPGIDGENADGGRWKDLRGCVRKKSTKGGRGQKGKMGGVGGNGGSGGDVIFKIENGTSKLKVLSTNGGLGGKPGLGGPGGDGGRGGDGSRGRNGCAGESSSEDGPRGPSGDIGLSGVKGKDGKVVDLNNI